MCIFFSTNADDEYFSTTFPSLLFVRIFAIATRRATSSRHTIHAMFFFYSFTCCVLVFILFAPPEATVRLGNETPLSCHSFSCIQYSLFYESPRETSSKDPNCNHFLRSRQEEEVNNCGKGYTIYIFFNIFWER